MRIAEYFMNIDNRLNNIDFLVGNIAPDSGVPNEDWSKFTPGKNISHWHANGMGVDAEDFRNKYVKRENADFDFYLGYYFHLLTDVAWKSFAQKNIEMLKQNKDLLWEIKKDWYGQDHVFLQNNPDSVFFTMFSKIKEYPNRFLDFFPKEAFMLKINYITDFYLNAKEDAGREFPYLSKSEMDYFVDNTKKSIEKIYKTL